MKVSTILDHIDSGHIALPGFQRGYVWNRDQVRGLFSSLYPMGPMARVRRNDSGDLHDPDNDAKSAPGRRAR
jgi:hypothetical protein